MADADQTSASPWQARHVVMAGGLIGAGSARDADLLLVVTHDGRGVVDCVTGQLVARDRDPDFPLDEDSREVPGIGPLADEVVAIAGEIYGGALLQATHDGWRLTGHLSNSADDVVQLLPPDAGMADPEAFTGFIPEIRVFGFSPTGRSFVIGTGAAVYTFAR